MEDTRRKLLENFDAEVHDRLKVNMAKSKEYLDRFARMLWAVTKHRFGETAKFDDDYLTFMLKASPDGIKTLREATIFRGTASMGTAIASAIPSLSIFFPQPLRAS